MELTMQERLKLIEFFEFQRDTEASNSPEKMNGEAIDAYVNTLLKLQDKNNQLSSDFIEQQVRKIFHSEDQENTVSETVKPQKRYNKRIIWIIAACIALLATLFTMISVATDDWSFMDFINDTFGSVHSAPIGEEFDYNGETIICNGKSTTYSSIEDVLKDEKIDILYPANLPDDIKVTEIVFDGPNSIKNASYVFNDKNLSSNIYFDTKISQAEKEVSTEVIEINSITCYICEMDDVSKTQISFEYEGNTYTFFYSEKATLIEIIENLKEIKKDD